MTNPTPAMASLSFRVPADLLESFERIAASEDRTISAELRRLMRQHVEANARSSTEKAA